MLKSVHLRIPEETYNTFKSFLESETISGAVIRLMREEIRAIRVKRSIEVESVKFIDGKKYVLVDRDA